MRIVSLLVVPMLLLAHSACSGGALDSKNGAKPGQVRNLRATPGDGMIRLQWEEPTDKGNEGDEVFRYHVRDPDHLVDVETDGAVPGMDVPGLTNGITYTFRVTAENSVEESIAVEVTAMPSPPGVPAQIQRVFASPGNGTVALSWEPPVQGHPPIQRYEVQLTPTEPSAVIAEIGMNLSTMISALRNGTEYAFAVRAVNEIGPGAWSEPELSMPATALPGPPLNVAVRQAFEPGTAELSWDRGVPGMTPTVRYELRSNPPSTMSPTVVTATDEEHYSVFLSGLDLGVKFSFQVVAVNSDGKMPSEPTEPMKFLGPPTPPRKVEASALPGGKIEVSWIEPLDDGGEDITGYEVVDADSTKTNFDVDADETRYRIPTQKVGKKYKFKVRAKNKSMGWGPFSEASDSVMQYGVPDAPTGVVVTSGGGLELEVKWSEPKNDGGDVEDYLVEVIGPTSNSKVVSGSKESTEIDVKAEGSYSVRVRSRNVAGESGAAGSGSVTLCTAPKWACGAFCCFF